ncbi:MAG: diguanylate cyclase [Anaerolineae bacterium]|nr:MAG: diguanylate cyclase [Anaerolineae bacterium]
MSLNEFAYIAFLVLAPILALILSIWVALMWQHRHMAGTWYLLVSTALLAGWLVSNTVELLVHSPEGTLFASHITYIFIALFPVTFFQFALEYTQSSWRTKIHKWYALLYIMPVLTILMAFRLGNNNLWMKVAYPEYFGLVSIRVLSYGRWFWVHTAYSYLLTLCGWGLLAHMYFARLHTTRRASRLILVGVLLAFVTNLAYVLKLLPITKDYTPISLAVSDILIILGVLRERLFDLRPLAALTVSENLGDGIFLLDAEEHIIDVNKAGEALLQMRRSDIIGQPAWKILCNQPEQQACFRSPQAEHMEITVRVNGHRPLPCDMQCLPIHNQRGTPMGRVVSLRDITSHKQYETLLLTQVEQFNQLYQASHALLESIDPQDILPKIVQNAFDLAHTCRVVVWHPLHASLPETPLAYPPAEAAPPLHLSEGVHPEAGPLPSRTLHTPRGEIFLQPIQNQHHTFGLLAFHQANGESFTPERLKIIANFALSAAAALQNALYHAAIEQSAITDALTHTYNRHGLHQWTRKRFRAGQEPCAVFMLDMDNLKTLNDACGHDVGDRALQIIGDILREQVRDGDMVSRYGGDEFLLILPGTTQQTAIRIAHRLHENIRKETLPCEAGEIFISVSIGVTTSLPGEPIEETIKRADAALYQAKDSGKNRVAYLSATATTA